MLVCDLRNLCKLYCVLQGLDRVSYRSRCGLADQCRAGADMHKLPDCIFGAKRGLWSSEWV